MNVFFEGDLKRVVAPSIGEHGLDRVRERARRARKPFDETLTVQVAGKDISATGRYDPKTKSLTIIGYLR